MRVKELTDLVTQEDAIDFDCPDLFPKYQKSEGYHTFTHQTNCMFTPDFPKFHDFQAGDISVALEIPKSLWPESLIVNEAPYGWIITLGNTKLHRDLFKFDTTTREVILRSRNQDSYGGNITANLADIDKLYKIVGCQRGAVEFEDEPF